MTITSYAENTRLTQIEERVADFERRFEAPALDLIVVLLVVRQIGLLGRLGAPALRHEVDVQALVRREDDDVTEHAAVDVDDAALVRRPVEDLDVVERAAGADDDDTTNQSRIRFKLYY